MSIKYLFPCQCGAKLQIEKSQAGQPLTCACGTALNAPTLREMMRLPQIETSDKLVPKREWNRVQGSLFAAGVLVTALAVLSTAFFAVTWYGIPVLEQPDTVEATAEWNETVLAKMSPEEVLKTWRDVEKGGMGPWRPSDHILAREVKSSVLRNLVISIIAVAIGMALIGSSFVMKPAKGAVPQRR